MLFPQIILTGTPYEKGLIHGSQCKAQVLASIQHYQREFEISRGICWKDAQKLAEVFLPVFTGEYKKYLEEMRGIAEGAGVGFTEILALNLRTELIFSGLVEEWKREKVLGECRGDKNDGPADNLGGKKIEITNVQSSASLEREGGCTAFAALPPATGEGCCLAGQTWDFSREQSEATLIAHIPAEDNTPAILLFLEGGLVGGKGINAAGLCLTLNALDTKESTVGIPLHIRMRRVLECTTLNDAYIEACVTPIPMAACLIITHKDGISLGLELDPSGVDVIMPKDGLLVHTNHFYGPRMILNHAHRSNGSSYIRLQRLQRLMFSKAGRLTQTDIENFFCDHAGYPNSICTHPNPILPYEMQAKALSTNYAFVVNLTQGKIRFVEGNPCEGKYELLSI